MGGALTSDAQRTRLSLVYRLPVYFGMTRSDFFSADRMRQVMGYKYTDAEQLMKLRTQSYPKYVVVGKVYVADPVYHLGSYYVLHAWGINLESKDTTDYKRFFGSGSFDEQGYREEMRTLVHNIIDGVVWASSGRPVTLRMGAIGMGAFLKQMPEKYRETAMQLLWRSLAEATQGLPLVRVQLCVFGDPRVWAAAAGSGLHVLQDTDLFAVEPHRAPEQVTVVLNAWDDCAYIGNGGSRDATIDGFMVAGYWSTSHGRGNTKFINTSYLHNVFFMPHLVDSLYYPGSRR
eukprot:NODE_1914_length_1036_cov_103.139818_g1556_i0.p1 GENE.NODE_1914_length_1036_cov_103.139818_g1556_i0~~NODE_1914_length_1036_cov_103.139818_g1556_i0.p1  ORF type:complete len:298 (+),score=82.31 NODE_1914_length_1036_cov_103.139818_g1556_i0:29-895(+)